MWFGGGDTLSMLFLPTWLIEMMHDLAFSFPFDRSLWEPSGLRGREAGRSFSFVVLAGVSNLVQAFVGALHTVPSHLELFARSFLLKSEIRTLAFAGAQTEHVALLYKK